MSLQKFLRYSTYVLGIFAAATLVWNPETSSTLNKAMFTFLMFLGLTGYVEIRLSEIERFAVDHQVVFAQVGLPCLVVLVAMLFRPKDDPINAAIALGTLYLIFELQLKVRRAAKRRDLL